MPAGHEPYSEFGRSALTCACNDSLQFRPAKFADGILILFLLRNSPLCTLRETRRSLRCSLGGERQDERPKYIEDRRQRRRRQRRRQWSGGRRRDGTTIKDDNASKPTCLRVLTTYQPDTADMLPASQLLMVFFSLHMTCRVIDFRHVGNLTTS